MHTILIGSTAAFFGGWKWMKICLLQYFVHATKFQSMIQHILFSTVGAYSLHFTALYNIRFCSAEFCPIAYFGEDEQRRLLWAWLWCQRWWKDCIGGALLQLYLYLCTMYTALVFTFVFSICVRILCDCICFCLGKEGERECLMEGICLCVFASVFTSIHTTYVRIRILFTFDCVFDPANNGLSANKRTHLKRNCSAGILVKNPECPLHKKVLGKTGWKSFCISLFGTTTTLSPSPNSHSSSPSTS